MKEIKAVIQPHMLHRVLDALHEIDSEAGGLPAVAVSEIESISVASGRYQPVKKTRLELMVSDEIAPRVIEAIQTHAHTGQAGDGRIFVIAVEETVKIRTGEHELSGENKSENAS